MDNIADRWIVGLHDHGGVFNLNVYMIYDFSKGFLGAEISTSANMLKEQMHKECKKIE